MRTTRSKAAPLGIAFALIISILAAGCSKPEPIRIGFVAGTSGRVADLGIAGRNAAILAVERKNASGGINGHPIELLVRNDEQNPDTARRVVQELIDAKVEAIVGHMTSSMTAATLPLANEAKMLMISPTTTSKDFSDKDDYFFRVIASTRAYSVKSALFHRNQLGLTRMAVAYDLRNRSYCESWLSDYRSTFEKAGGKIAQVATFESGSDVSIRDLVKQLLTTHPDGVLVIANAVDAALFAQQIRQQSPKTVIAGAEWAGTEQLIELGGQAVEGMYLAQFVDRTSRAPAYLSFRQDYLKRFGSEPGFGGTTAYDATTVLLTALERRKSGQSLKEAILAIRTFRGLQDDFSFDPNGETMRRHYITTIKDGQFTKAEE